MDYSHRADDRVVDRVVEQALDLRDLDRVEAPAHPPEHHLDHPLDRLQSHKETEAICGGTLWM